MASIFNESVKGIEITIEMTVDGGFVTVSKTSKQSKQTGNTKASKQVNKQAQ